MHHFIMLSIDTYRQEKLRINLSQEEIIKKFGPDFEPEKLELTYVLIGKIFRHIAGIERIVIPTQEFTSEKDKKSKAVSCSVKA